MFKDESIFRGKYPQSMSILICLLILAGLPFFKEEFAAFTYDLIRNTIGIAVFVLFFYGQYTSVKVGFLHSYFKDVKIYKDKEPQRFWFHWFIPILFIATLFLLFIYQLYGEYTTHS